MTTEDLDVIEFIRERINSEVTRRFVLMLPSILSGTYVPSIKLPGKVFILNEDLTIHSVHSVCLGCNAAEYADYISKILGRRQYVIEEETYAVVNQPGISRRQ